MTNGEAAGRIVVCGATGFTGTLVAETLAGGDHPFVLTGRDERRLARLGARIGGAETRTVDVTEPSSLRRLLRAGDVVINCAGPFSDLGEPVVEACVAQGAHYLDTTGEQRFMKRVLDRFDAPARAAGVAVVNAMAFEYAIGDCAAALAAEGLPGPLRSVDLVYAWGGGAAASSRGTRMSVLRVIREGGYSYRDGRWVEERVGAEQREVPLPSGMRAALSFPAGEVLTVPRHLEVAEVRGWMAIDPVVAALVPLLGPALPPAMGMLEPLARWWIGRGAEGPTAEQREQSTYLIRAEATGADGTRREVTARGVDPYGVTAAIAVRAAVALLQEGVAGGGGVLAPAQVLRPASFRTESEAWRIRWEERDASA